MYKIVVKPVPVDKQKRLQFYLKHTEYRFVFYTYGTLTRSEPHYALYVYSDWNTLAELYISEYILYQEGPAVS